MSSNKQPSPNRNLSCIHRLTNTSNNFSFCVTGTYAVESRSGYHKMTSNGTSAGEIVSSKTSRVASKSSSGSGLSAGRAIQATNNDSVNNSKSTPEKRSSPACSNGESPRKLLRRRGVKTEEDDDEDLETGTPPEVVDDGPIEDENARGNVDTICEDVSVAVTGKKNIRGKVWRARNGDYVRYLCVDDGADYRPGGMLFFILALAEHCFSSREIFSNQTGELTSR